MSLADELAEHFGDQDMTINALGMVFMVVRLSMKPDDYRQLQDALPESEAWVKRAMSGSMARTGEMLAIQSPEAVRGRLEKAGLEDTQVEHLAARVHDVLEGVLGTDVLDALVGKVPLLSTANR